MTVCGHISACCQQLPGLVVLGVTQAHGHLPACPHAAPARTLPARPTSCPSVTAGCCARPGQVVLAASVPAGWALAHPPRPAQAS